MIRLRSRISSALSQLSHEQLSCSRSTLVSTPLALRIQRPLSTSNDHRDLNYTAPKLLDRDFPGRDKIEREVAIETKYWKSLGVNPTDRLEDTVRGTYRIYAYLIGALFLPMWALMYVMDARRMYDRDWLMREARFELERRERLGLPRVDPDLLPVDSLHLPSEEELGDFEIVI